MFPATLGFIWSDWLSPGVFLQRPWLLILAAFQIWMLVDAWRRQEWFWVALLVIFPLFNAILYFFLVYQRSSPGLTSGFELPGTFSRKRVKELQAAIHHLDKAHHHAELAGIYFQQGKLAEAEASYRAAVERDGEDADFQARLGQCLLRQGKLDEARPLLEKVAVADPKHDYGHTLMAFAEVLARQGEKDRARSIWETVLESHSYARARVQYAELLLDLGERDKAVQELKDFLADEAHTVPFQARRDKVWIRKAKALLR